MNITNDALLHHRMDMIPAEDPCIILHLNKDRVNNDHRCRRLISQANINYPVRDALEQMNTVPWSHQCTIKDLWMMIGDFLRNKFRLHNVCRNREVDHIRKICPRCNSTWALLRGRRVLRPMILEIGIEMVNPRCQDLEIRMMTDDHPHRLAEVHPVHGIWIDR